MPQGIAVSSEYADLNSGVSLSYVHVFVVDRYSGCVKVFKRLSGRLRCLKVEWQVEVIIYIRDIW